MGAFILFFPFLIECILAAVLPSQQTIINSIRGTISAVGTQDLSRTITNYGKQIVPYYLNDSTNSSQLSIILRDIYTSSNKPGLTLTQLNSTKLNDYVLNRRKSNLTAFLYDYYVGMGFSIVNSSYFEATGYYSTMAYHSSATILNEINNILLKYYTGNKNKSLTTINSPLPSDGSSLNKTDILDVLACIDSLPISLINFSKNLKFIIYLNFVKLTFLF